MKVRPLHRLAGPNPQPLQGLGIGQPAAGSLDHLVIGGQVVVPAPGLNRLALQVARVPAAPRRTYARRRHHMGDDPQRAKPAKQFAQHSLCHGTVHLVVEPCALTNARLVGTQECLQRLALTRSLRRRQAIAREYFLGRQQRVYRVGLAAFTITSSWALDLEHQDARVL